MSRRARLAAWIVGFAAFMVMGVPWFLWGSSTVRFGLPLWVWYHVGWLVGAAVVFWAFARWFWRIDDGRQ